MISKVFVYPQFDPVAVRLGSLKIHWYGLMYLIGLSLGWWLGRWRAKRLAGWHPEEIDELVGYMAVGVIAGGRIGYMLFYHPDFLLEDPLSLFRIWEGGMSFHGGLLGVMTSLYFFARKFHKTFWQVADFVAPLVPVGLLFGRIGNFINGELWGRPTDVPWAMVFPHVDGLPRHPSQLYEAFLEGVVLFVILWLYVRKPRPTMASSGLFLLGYGCFRFFVEFFREPDAHLGFIAFGWMTMGQLLSLPMIVAGILLLYLAYRHAELPRTPA